MNIRPIKEDDLKECANIFKHVFSSEPWNEPWTCESAHTRLDHFFKSVGFYGLLAEVNSGNISGFILGNKEPFCHGELFYLREMCVNNEEQGSGIGSSLLAALEENLTLQGVRGAYLATAKDIPAAAFYQKNEFKISSGMGFYNKRLGT